MSLTTANNHGWVDSVTRKRVVWVAPALNDNHFCRHLLNWTILSRLLHENVCSPKSLAHKLNLNIWSPINNSRFDVTHSCVTVAEDCSVIYGGAGGWSYDLWTPLLPSRLPHVPPIIMCKSFITKHKRAEDAQRGGGVTNKTSFRQSPNPKSAINYSSTPDYVIWFQ